MKVKKLIEILQDYPENAKVCFYDFIKCDEMFLEDISISYNDKEIYFNVAR